MNPAMRPRQALSPTNEGDRHGRHCRQVFDADELEELGERMARRKESARQELFGAVR
jgi:hypothetical protein